MSHQSDEFMTEAEREAGAPENCGMLGVAFGLHPMLNDQKTQDAGFDVYDDVVHVKIVIPGDQKNVFFQPATDAHKKRFPKAWGRFQSMGAKPREGMPIEQWAAISRSLAMTLKAANVDTVESLANVHDGLLDKLGSTGRELRTKAQAWVAQQKDSSAVLKVASEKEALQVQIQELKDRLNEVLVNRGGNAAVDEIAAAARKPKAKKVNVDASVVA